MKKRNVNVAIFASGSGTNAEAIIKSLEKQKSVRVTRIYSNNPKAFVLKRAKAFGLPVTVFNRQQFYDSEFIIETLVNEQTDLIVLAGFMWLVPANLVRKFPDRIVNIHPALLPKYGGKGLYGHHVHEAVIADKEEKSGITIHYVNEKYDDGNIIFQTVCEVRESDTPDDLANRIHSLEHLHYPRVIRDLAMRIKSEAKL
jgi:phosphoribosylglycinamide formyltransferase-1